QVAAAAAAEDQAGQWVEPVMAPRSAAAGVLPTDLLDARPQLVADRRIGAPGGRHALLGMAPAAAAAHRPAVVDRVAQHLAHALLGEAGVGLIATTNTSDSNYSGDFYPNSEHSIENTVSSLRNLFTNRDITFAVNS